MEALFNYHYDFIKIKLYEAETDNINWESLKPHKNLKRHYTLISNGRFCDKNFDLFMDEGNNITIRTSIPYLVYGHNFKSFDGQELSENMNSLSLLLGLDFTQAKVLELEFGAYTKIDVSPQCFINNLIGLEDYKIEKVTLTMKMFGKTKGCHFKVYDPIANSKSKKTFSISKYPNEQLIKYELKSSGLKNFTVEQLCKLEVFNDFKTSLKAHIDNLIIRKELEYLPIEASVNHILFASLKNMEQQSNVSVYSQITSVLDKMKLTASQKCKRRKTLLDLETTYNARHKKR